MPDAVLFLKAMAAAAGASAIVVLAFGLFQRPASASRINLAAVLGIGVGLILGFYVLELQPDWPPAGGLDRFLTIIFPAALPLAAALAGVALAAVPLAARPGMEGALGIGVIGLFGLLFVGRFFGGLSTARALAVFFAPLLCWVSEIPQLRGRKPWLIAGT